MTLDKPLTKAQIHALFASQPRVPFHDRRALPADELIKGFQEWFAEQATKEINQPK